MGYHRHHTIVVTSWSEDGIDRAHREALAVFSDTLAAVSDISPGTTNGYRSFFVAPDGSKEGWPPSDAADLARERYIGWLTGQAYEDGSHALDWIVVNFGGDDHDVLSPTELALAGPLPGMSDDPPPTAGPNLGMRVR